MFKLNRALTALSVIALCAPFVAACSSATGGVETVTPRVELVDRTHQALATGALQWASGTYTGCRDRADTEKWSVRISGEAPMSNPALTVVKNDIDCDLTLTELSAAAAYGATPTILLTSEYNAVGSEMKLAEGGSPTAFYANAKIEGASFSGDFLMTILFSDDIRDTNANTTATYTTVTSTASESLVPAPNYTVGFDNLVLKTDADDLASVTGNVTLTEGTLHGEQYIVSTHSSAPLAVAAKFDVVKAAFLAGGTPKAVGTSILAAELDLDGEHLTTTRNVIIVHELEGVMAYEVIRITFNPRTPTVN